MGDTAILIFLAVGVGILFLAWLLSRLFRRQIGRDKAIDSFDNHDDLNGRRGDARSTATWIGINQAPGGRPGGGEGGLHD